MKKAIFISYANDAMAYSLKRIGRQARRLGVFNEVIMYTPEDVPDYVRESRLFAAKRGAGYWCWKPAIIEDALNRFEDGSVVVYVDAGCTLRKGSLWKEYLDYMQDYDTLCFQYDENQPQWKKWGATSSKMKYWTKKESLDFLCDYSGHKGIGDICQVWGGCLFFKGQNNELLRTWHDLTFSHPDLIEDPSSDEMKDQYPWFAGHRHDQSLLTSLAVCDSRTLVLPEASEHYNPESIVWASRIRARSFCQYLEIQFKHSLRRIIGDKLYEELKHII